MENPINDRRRISHAGLLDSIIRMVAQLTLSNDLAARSLASRALADLQKLRQSQPRRRLTDGKNNRV